jgi:hypothetical protein
MKMKMEVFCRTRFVAFHQWENAPEKYAYLGYIHRHEFHVEVGVYVELSNREVEFHELRTFVDAFIHANFGHLVTDSCETIASRIAGHLRGVLNYRVSYVEVSEDGECGGRVFYE